MAKDEKIIERVKALLAMGNDVSSPNEAAIALKRARALMDKHQIGMNEIQAWDKDDNNFDEATVETNSSNRKRWLEMLVAAVSKLNDCTVRIRRKYDEKSDKIVIFYLFQGFAEDVALSEFMASYLSEACETLYKRDKERLGIEGNQGRNSYLVGISNGLCERIEIMIEERKQQDMTLSTGTSLMLLKSEAVKEKFGETKYSTARVKRSINHDAYQAGQKASKEVHLGSFVENSNKSESLAAI